MKTLTVKQPWAILIVQGIKPIENRTWRTNFRGRVLIHASANSIPIRNPNSVFTSKQWDSLSECEKAIVISGKSPVSAIIGSVEIVDCVQNHPSVWAEQGVYNWVLANPIMFDKPIEAVKGKLSLWEYDLQEEPKHAPKYMRHHMSMNLAGLLRNYERRNMKGVFLDEKECPDFDHFGKGCPGHRIAKEDYERDLTK